MSVCCRFKQKCRIWNVSIILPDFLYTSSVSPDTNNIVFGVLLGGFLFHDPQW